MSRELLHRETDGAVALLTLNAPETLNALSTEMIDALREALLETAADRAIRVTLADYGVAESAAEVRISCLPTPNDCLERRGFVPVEVIAQVPLPLAPVLPGLDVPPGVTVQSSSTEQVSRFRVGS